MRPASKRDTGVRLESDLDEACKRATPLPIEEKREAAGRAYDSAKKTVRDTVTRVSDRAKKAMSSSKSSELKRRRWWGRHW